MDIIDVAVIIAAVLAANALSFAFFMAAMKCSKLQKEGVPDDRLPLWVYAGLLVPMGFAFIGLVLLEQ